MHLSRHSDYACRVLLYLTASDTRSASIDEIAEAYQISKNHLVKVVHKLSKLGFIETVRGRGGGIHLVRDPASIKVGDIVRQTENFDMVECFNPDTNSCVITASCGLKPIIGKAMRAFLETLDQVPLTEIVGNKKKTQSSLGLDSAAKRSLS